MAAAASDVETPATDMLLLYKHGVALESFRTDEIFLYKFVGSNLQTLQAGGHAVYNMRKSAVCRQAVLQDNTSSWLVVTAKDTPVVAEEQM